MKLFLASVFVVLFGVQLASAEQLEFFTDSQVYSPDKPLIVYGKALPSEDVVLRFTGPDENVITFTQVTADKDGKFQTSLFVWPQASTTIPYGTYVV
ncbi:MAG: methyl-accepting chemotaxis protein, partial [Thaumarchaeota archaeon]|nr:methyl-accepting chemotaxis protein [Nitrososphaerota archaeon]